MCDEDSASCRICGHTTVRISWQCSVRVCLDLDSHVHQDSVQDHLKAGSNQYCLLQHASMSGIAKVGSLRNQWRQLVVKLSAEQSNAQVNSER